MANDQIPFLDVSRDILGPDVDQNEKRKGVCDRVREACETHGCFICVCDMIPASLNESMLVAMKALFDLPEETKNKYVNPKPYRSYMAKCPIVPILESLGIDDATKLDVAQDFTCLMWPEGNSSFCETLNTMSSKMLELSFLILKMITESLGMKSHDYGSHFLGNTSLFRLMKYKAPPTGCTSANGLPTHTDKNALTILCQNEVPGLEVQTKDGTWIQVVPPRNAFAVIVGDALKAWSNGRLHAARHRVVISGDEERYSCGLFSMPEEGTLIEVPRELVDNDHPLLYRPFNYADFISYFVTQMTEDALDVYAAL